MFPLWNGEQNDKTKTHFFALRREKQSHVGTNRNRFRPVVMLRRLALLALQCKQRRDFVITSTCAINCDL